MNNLNMDLSQLVVSDVNVMPWQRSPGGEVERRMFEREHAESGRTTSIVRYPTGSRFPQHTHHGGEEFLVLEGVFSDEYGDYPAGTYIRNPRGTKHAPYSRPGCIIFVKLCQMAPHEEQRLVVDTDTDRWERVAQGLRRQALYKDDSEQVDLLDAVQNCHVDFANAELLLLRGAFEFGNVTHVAQTWLRIPVHQRVKLELQAGSRLWIKRGHLGGT